MSLKVTISYIRTWVLLCCKIKNAKKDYIFDKFLWNLLLQHASSYATAFYWQSASSVCSISDFGCNKQASCQTFATLIQELETDRKWVYVFCKKGNRCQKWKFIFSQNQNFVGVYGLKTKPKLCSSGNNIQLSNCQYSRQRKLVRFWPKWKK